jgi:hypothetical protein
MESSQTPLERQFCARCGGEIDPEEHFEVFGEETVKLCRVEHIVGWVMRGARWKDGTPAVPGESLTLVRRRAGAEITEVFETPEALRAWASAGGPWGKSSGI